MYIFEDPWHSQMLPSVWQWSCHYLFLRLRSVATVILCKESATEHGSLIVEIPHINMNYDRKSQLKLDEKVSQDVIEKVEEPSLWVLPVVVVPDKNDIRLCGDIRQANQAVFVKGTRYPSFKKCYGTFTIALYIPNLISNSYITNLYWIRSQDRLQHLWSTKECIGIKD